MGRIKRRRRGKEGEIFDGMFNALGILCGKSASFAANGGSSLFLTLSTGSHPSANFSKGVRMSCGIFSSSRSEEGFSDTCKSTLSLSFNRLRDTLDSFFRTNRRAINL